MMPLPLKLQENPKVFPMKSFMLGVLLLCLSSIVHAEPLSNSPPTKITGMVVSNDLRTISFRYERAGQERRQSVVFTKEIADFRYCRWLGDLGVAIAIETTSNEFYYVTRYFGESDAEPKPEKVPAPAGNYSLLGVANTGGDSIVISAIAHRRDDPDPTRYGPDQLSGWMFVDNCPPIGASVGVVIPFDIAEKRAEKRQ